MAFVDTSALYALLDRDDACHGRAAKIWNRLLQDSRPLKCSNYVLIETVALVQRRLGMEALRALAEDLIPVLEVIWVQPDQHQTALEEVFRQGRRNLSLVDCTSFVLMKDAEIKHAFCFDRHFEEEGFDTLSP